MNNSIFITGTDTGIGKTYVSVQLIKQLNQSGFKTFAMKPLASGCDAPSGHLINDDALQLQRIATIKSPYDMVNPIALKLPIAPHLAAKRQGVNLSVDFIAKVIQRSVQNNADVNIIEGVGGWSVPINQNELLSQVVVKLNLPVILVVGIRLGCLNHAILTYDEIVRSGSNLIGWIANCIDPKMQATDENIYTLKSRLQAPCLGILPYNGQLSLPSKFVDMLGIFRCRS